MYQRGFAIFLPYPSNFLLPRLENILKLLVTQNRCTRRRRENGSLKWDEMSTMYPWKLAVACFSNKAYSWSYVWSWREMLCKRKETNLCPSHSICEKLWHDKVDIHKRAKNTTSLLPLRKSGAALGNRREKVLDPFFSSGMFEEKLTKNALVSLFFTFDDGIFCPWRGRHIRQLTGRKRQKGQQSPL